MLAILDGTVLPVSEARIPVTDDGLLRGDAVFEVIRLYGGLPFALDDHLARMERSAHNLRLPFDPAAVRADVEALLVTPHGRVLEGPTAAFFCSLDGETLVTPPLDDHILDSITRRRLLELTGATERAVVREELPGLREAFLASTLREVHPVHSIDGAALPGAPGPLTRAAAAAMRERIAQELGLPA